MANKEIIEELASLEHDQWVDWTKAIANDIKGLLDIADIACYYSYTNREEDNLVIEQSERLERWEKLWIPYEELSEEMKESDREYARKAYAVMNDKDMIVVPRKLLLELEHELTYLHGLYASDLEEFSVNWRLDNKTLLKKLNDSLRKE